MAKTKSPARVVLCTTTLYPNTSCLRYVLALATICEADSHKLPIVVVDESPCQIVHDGLGCSSYAHVFKGHNLGMGTARRLALLKAQQLTDVNGCIIWLEPEKHDLVGFVPQLSQPILDKQAQVVMAARTERGWQSYPAFQRELERQANTAYQLVTGRPDDPTFGPVAMSNRAAERLIGFAPNKHGLPDTYIQHYLPFLTGLDKVTSVTVDFRYPDIQRQQEEAADNQAIRIKRDCQLAELTAAYRKLAQLFLR